jgi:hypothetical protein
MQLVIIEVASKLPRRRIRIRAVVAAAPPCCGTTPYCADRFLSMQTRWPRVRHERAPLHWSCTKRSLLLRDSCRTMLSSAAAGGSRPCPRLRALPQRFPGLAPPACKHAAATRHSSAPTPAAQRTTRRCLFPVRCRLCRRRELCAPGMCLQAWTVTAGPLQLCRAALRFPPSRPSLASLVPYPSAVSHRQICGRVDCRVQRRSPSRSRMHRSRTTQPQLVAPPPHTHTVGNPKYPLSESCSHLRYCTWNQKPDRWQSR